MEPKNHSYLTIILSLLAIFLIGGLSYLTFNLRTTVLTQAEDKAALEAAAAERAAHIDQLENENKTLSEALYSEQQKNENFERQIDKLTGTVDDLEKLSETDPELLQKYSKVYFLNEHYAPEDFKAIPKQWVLPEGNVQNIHAKIYPFLEDLLEAAEKADIDLRVVSAFRSFAEQTSLKSNYKVTYGAGTANQFSADQGYSEHQLGTTVDFSTPTLNGAIDGFDTTPAYQWLLKNAWRYGFVLSYPANNAYYQFEPWHWRFVGKDLARYLDRSDKSFYDIDQRTIDEYLISFFDK